MSNEQPSFTVTQPRIGLVLGLIAVLTFCWQGISFVNDHAYRLKMVEIEQQEQRNFNRELIAEIKSMNAKVVDLLVSLKQIQARQIEEQQQ